MHVDNPNRDGRLLTSTNDNNNSLYYTRLYYKAILGYTYIYIYIYR